MKGKTKIQTISLLTCLGILIPIFSLKDTTILALDPYWRYQGSIIARNIIETHHISLDIYSEQAPQLLKWVDSFTSNFGSPLIVAIVSQVLGLPIVKVQSLPLYAISFALLSISLAKRVGPLTKIHVLPSISILIVSFQFIRLHSLSVAHRSSLGWSLLLLAILIIFLYQCFGGVYLKLTLIATVVSLTVSFQTIAVASLSFFFLLWFGSRFTSDRYNVSTKSYVLISVIIISYYGIVENWLGVVALKFFIASGSFSVGQYDITTLINTISLSSGIYETRLSKYILEKSPPKLYKLSLWYARIVAVSLVLVSVLIRFKQILHNYTIGRLDVFLFAVAGQGIAYVLISPYFAASGGINPRLLGLTILPIAATIPLSLLANSRVFSNRNIGLVVVSLVVLSILISAPAMYASQSKPHTPVNQAKKVTEDTKEQVSWTVRYVDNKTLTSDFNTLSTYYTLGGTSHSYLPSPGEPAFGTKSVASKYIRLYYTKPELRRSLVDTYIVTDNLERNGMQHLGALVTKPNPHLGNSLSSSDDWNKVYSEGDGYIFNQIQNKQ